MARPRLDITGFRSGKLVAVKPGPHDSAGKACWVVRCDCGNTRLVRTNYITKQVQKSCGCYNPAGTTHGKTDTFEFRVWTAMRKRCLYEKHLRYKHYGGRGIRICDRWSSFENFLEDMGICPIPDGSIERVDVNGNYEPGNCVWLPRRAQSKNRRNVRRA